ncbi:hypothetical protein ABW48_19885 [Pluralibacter gergoviae]|nr:hypothetical protein ABW48_19885 [Pluralibacter gergoviae]
MSDLRATVVPRSDQINFEDVQSQNITASIKSVRAGNSEQPVFIDLDGYDGRPYKPSKTMRRVLVEAWGENGHAWVGRSLTIYGDPSVKFGGVAVGGIKISAMSDIEADFSMMLSVSRGKRQEHRVQKLEVKKPLTAPEILAWFSNEALTADLAKLNHIHTRTKEKLSGHQEELAKLEKVYSDRKGELEAK